MPRYAAEDKEDASKEKKKGKSVKRKAGSADAVISGKRSNVNDSAHMEQKKDSRTNEVNPSLRARDAPVLKYLKTDRGIQYKF